jgi:hypothetical protein
LNEWEPSSRRAERATPVCVDGKTEVGRLSRHKRGSPTTAALHERWFAFAFGLGLGVAVGLGTVGLVVGVVERLDEVLTFDVEIGDDAIEPTR